MRKKPNTNREGTPCARYEGTGESCRDHKKATIMIAQPTTSAKLKSSSREVEPTWFKQRPGESGRLCVGVQAGRQLQYYVTNCPSVY
jgi:hypothetical protein